MRPPRHRQSVPVARGHSRRERAAQPAPASIDEGSLLLVTSGNGLRITRAGRLPTFLRTRTRRQPSQNNSALQLNTVKYTTKKISGCQAAEERVHHALNDPFPFYPRESRVGDQQRSQPMNSRPEGLAGEFDVHGRQPAFLNASRHTAAQE